MLSQFDVTPTQKMYLKNMDYTGICLRYKEPLVLELFNEAFLKLIEKHVFMRSCIDHNSKGCFWKLYSVPTNIEIPFLDISGYEKSFRKKIIDKCISSIYLKEYKKSQNIFYRVIVIKESLNNYILVIPFAHIIFDAISSDVLLNDLLNYYQQLANGEKVAIIESERYFKYLRQLNKGPQNINDDLLNKEFSLDKFYDLTKKIKKVVNSFSSRRNTRFDIIVGRDINNNALGEALKVILKLCETIFGLSEIPIWIVNMGRIYEEQAYVDLIGAFVDYVPCMFSSDTNIEELQGILREKLELKRKSNINFTRLMSRENENNNFIKSCEYLYNSHNEFQIVFNFIGVDHCDNQEFKGVIYSNSNNTLKNTILFTIKFDKENLKIMTNATCYISEVLINEFCQNNIGIVDKLIYECEGYYGKH